MQVKFHIFLPGWFLLRLYDSIRKKWVASTPEEIVRQKFIAYLVESCQFPKELMSVEKALSELPHLRENKGKLPERRFDLLCFGPKLSFPLLLVECKATRLNQKSLLQLWGYNAYVKAPFVALVNGDQLIIEWEENGEKTSLNVMPTYHQLIEVRKRARSF